MFGFSALSDTLNLLQKANAELQRRLAETQSELQQEKAWSDHIHTTLWIERGDHDDLKKKYNNLLEEIKPKCGCRTCRRKCVCCS